MDGGRGSEARIGTDFDTTGGGGCGTMETKSGATALRLQFATADPGAKSTRHRGHFEVVSAAMHAAQKECPQLGSSSASRNGPRQTEQVMGEVAMGAEDRSILERRRPPRRWVSE